MCSFMYYLATSSMYTAIYTWIWTPWLYETSLYMEINTIQITTVPILEYFEYFINGFEGANVK